MSNASWSKLYNYGSILKYVNYNVLLVSGELSVVGALYEIKTGQC